LRRQRDLETIRKTPLTAIATHALFMKAVARFGSDAPEGLAELIIGGRDAGASMVADPRIKLVSATGSTRMGKQVAAVCAQRLRAAYWNSAATTP
jgi:aldehyde dehydrogenase (NAD+)